MSAKGGREVVVVWLCCCRVSVRVSVTVRGRVEGKDRNIIVRQPLCTLYQDI